MSTPNKYTFLTQQIAKLQDDKSPKPPLPHFKRDSLDSQITDFKLKLLTRNQSNMSFINEQKQQTAKFSNIFNTECNNSQLDQTSVESSSPKDSMKQEESSIMIDNSQILESKINNVKKVINRYKDQTIEQSFSLKSLLEDNESLAEQLLSSSTTYVQKTPPILNKYKRNSRNKEMKISNTYGVEKRNISKINNERNGQLIFDYNNIKEDIKFKQTSKNSLSEIEENIKRLATIDNFRVDNQKNHLQFSQSHFRGLETIEKEESNPSLNQQMSSLFQLRTIQQDFENTQAVSSLASTQTVEHQNLRLDLQKIEEGKGIPGIKPYLNDQKLPVSYQQISTPISSSNQETQRTTVRILNPLNSPFIETVRYDKKDKLECFEQSIKTQSQYKSPYNENRDQFNFQGTISSSRSQSKPYIDYSERQDRYENKEQEEERYQTNKQDLYKLIADMKQQIEKQAKLIDEKDLLLVKISSEKQVLEQQIQTNHQQLQQYIHSDETHSQMLRDKDNELHKLNCQYQEKQVINENLQRQIENLNAQIQLQIKVNEDERQRYKEMEDVVLVCRDQINSFDQINLMSQQVIERMEQQVNEYKYEIEQAKDTIDKQHRMYYDLVKTINEQQDQAKILERNQKHCFEQTSNMSSNLLEPKIIKKNQEEEQNLIVLKEVYVQKQDPLFSDNRQYYNGRNPLQQSKSLVEISQENHQPLISGFEKTSQKRKLIASPLRNPNYKRNFQRFDTQESQWKIIETTEDYM